MSFYWGPKVVTDGLIVYWDAANINSAASGSSTWYDLINSYDGTETNSPVYHENGYYSFLDTSDDAFLHTEIEFNSGSSWTFSMWQNMPSQQLWLSFAGNQLANGGYWMWHSSGKLMFYLDYYDSVIYGCGMGNSPDFTIRIGNGIELNKWFNITISYDNSTSMCRVNINGGELIEERILIWSTRPLTSAKFNGVNYARKSFTGNIATYMLWNKKLTDNEILQNYDSIKGRFGL